MARRYKQRRAKARPRKYTRRRNDLTFLAYKMGQVERGLKNPDSKISESFNRGATAPQKRVKKTLF